MICPQCKSKEFKTVTELDDAGDVERRVCANESCGYIISEELVIEAVDGTKMRRPRAVKQEDQPDSFNFGGTETEEPKDRLMSADEMMHLALKTQEETVGKAAREIARNILEKCAENVLEGEYTYLIEENDSPPGAVIAQAVKELKDRSYKVKQTPVPGKGVEVHVKWPTKKKASRRKKAAEVAPSQVGVMELTPKQKRQQEEKAKRKEALRARSGSRKSPPKR
jgi:hypothetical protein